MTNQGKIHIPANSVREFVSADIVRNIKHVALDVATERDGSQRISALVEYYDLDNILGRMSAKKEAALRKLMKSIEGEIILQGFLEIKHRNNTIYLPEMWI